ncbi:MAG: hypothetical protein KJZ91_14990 [Myxococcales bacterium]|nr:hypothetical protein [Myxococcales bacterium]
MVTRRALLTGVLAAPLALAAGGVGRVAHARRVPLRPGRVHRGTLAAKGRDLRPLVGPRGGGGGHVALGAPLALRAGARPGVFSLANANDLYAAVAQLAAPPAAMPFLMVRGGAVRAESWGTGFGEAGNTAGSASFHLDRALADEVAALWRVPRRDRVPLGAGLVARWRPDGPLRAGRAMPIVLTLDNRGAAPVWFNPGGRQRGPRDNRFAFEVARDGVALPVVDAPDFGGVGAYRSLAPGETLERVEDLRRWVAIDRPGRYQVTCRYHLELVTGADGARWPEHGHEVWDWATDDVITITVG